MVFSDRKLNLVDILLVRFIYKQYLPGDYLAATDRDHNSILSY